MITAKYRQIKRMRDIFAAPSLCSKTPAMAISTLGAAPCRFRLLQFALASHFWWVTMEVAKVAKGGLNNPPWKIRIQHLILILGAGLVRPQNRILFLQRHLPLLQPAHRINPWHRRCCCCCCCCCCSCCRVDIKAKHGAQVWLLGPPHYLNPGTPLLTSLSVFLSIWF